MQHADVVNTFSRRTLRIAIIEPFIGRIRVGRRARAVGSSRQNEWINRSTGGRGAVIYEHTRPRSAGKEESSWRCILRAPGIYNVAPFVCPVNYSRSKLSGNEVPGSSLGPSSLVSTSPFPLPPSSLSSSLSPLLFLGPCEALRSPPVGHPPVERAREPINPPGP